jgi:hypothetical protein
LSVMNRFVILACFASVLIQHQADNKHVGKQSQQNTQTSQNKTVAPTPSQTATDQKPAGNADKNQNQTVNIASIPKVAVKPEKDFQDWTMVLCTIVLTIVGIVGTCAAIKTLKAINRQVHYMLIHAKHFDKLAKATANQAVLMDRQLSQMTTAGTHTEQLAHQAVRQSDLTQRQFDLANRPWISIDFVKAASNLEFREDGSLIIFFGYQIRNAGHSVAQRILPWIEPIINGVDNPVEVRARISEQLKRSIDSYFDHGKLIFPNQVITDRYPVLIRPENLAQALEQSCFKNQDESVIRGIGLEIFVCFDYQSTLDSSKHHQTQSMYLIGYRGNGLFIQSQKSYGMDGLTLTFKGFGAYAD